MENKEDTHTHTSNPKKKKKEKKAQKRKQTMGSTLGGLLPRGVTGARSSVSRCSEEHFSRQSQLTCPTWSAKHQVLEALMLMVGNRRDS